MKNIKSVKHMNAGVYLIRLDLLGRACCDQVGKLTSKLPEVSCQKCLEFVKICNEKISKNK